MRLAVLDLPEGNAMRAPGEAPGLMALEIAMDEMAEKLGMDPIAFRMKNDTQVDPKKPERRFLPRQLVRCLDEGARALRLVASAMRQPAQVRDGRWLVGMGVASAFRNHMNMTFGRARPARTDGVVTVETDMTDIGTGSYTIIAQTAAEMMGVPVDSGRREARQLRLPGVCGVGRPVRRRQFDGGRLCRLRQAARGGRAAARLNSADAVFADGKVTQRQPHRRPATGCRRRASWSPRTRSNSATSTRHGSCPPSARISSRSGVDAYTGATRLRRMLAVCAAGRIINPTSARSQVIGAMTMGVGSALMEELAVDKRFGFFVNHDLASYEVPVHADIPHQEVVFLEEADDKANPMKAKGVGELGLCGVGAAVANAVYNATGVRVRDYPLTLDKHLERLPAVA